MKVLLITGASTGLGLSLTKQLLDKNYHLVLTARKSSLIRFEEASIKENEHLWIRPLDVTSDEQRRKLIEEIEEKLGGVDILINNAGIAYRAVVEHVSEEERLHQMSVNFRSPMELIRLVLPSMRKKRAGRIINVSSVGGMMAMPTMAVYSASKFALEGASESLYYEVKPWNIFVTLIEPGFINSSSFEKVPYTQQSSHSSQIESDAYHQHYKNMQGFITKVMKNTFASTDSVAKKIVKTIESRKPPLRVAGTLDARVFDIIRRVIPRRLYHWLLYRSLPGINNWGSNKP